MTTVAAAMKEREGALVEHADSERGYGVMTLVRRQTFERVDEVGRRYPVDMCWCLVNHGSEKRPRWRHELFSVWELKFVEGELGGWS